MRCPKCRAENALDARSCVNCGLSLKPATEPAMSPTRTILTPARALAPETIVQAKYRILREIGRGGMGIVYEAEDIRLNRTVALKFLPAELTSDPEARERFVQEARAASALDHPNICTIHEIDETESGDMFIAMACYAGESLEQKIVDGPVAAADVIAYSVQIAEGLAKAHERGIIHRDVKPGNILITSDGTAKIVDFGLAKLAGQVRRTLPGTTLGTVAYMSPEQARGEPADARTDVWSLGVVLYEMVTGELPFQGENGQAVLYAILNKPPKPVKTLRPGFPTELESIIRKALAKNPANRFASAQEMAEALRDLKFRMTAREYAAAKRLSFRRPGRRWLMAAASAMTIGAVALGIWLFTKPTLAFEIRDKLMVADVDNLTGDQVFDLALRTAIEADLQQSPYATIFDKPQIAETLRLMRMDPSSRVDEGLGYEVCRFGQVRAFILPRIMSVGEAYELQAILIDPVRRRHVDRIRITAKGKEDVLLHGIDKLAEQVRSRLGESLQSIEKADRPVVNVTTSSWDALNYMSMGLAKWQEGKYKEAAALLELALEKDPQFVDARGSLGLVLIQFLNEKEKGKAMLRQALQDAQAQDLPQRDLLKLKATHKQFVEEDLPGALEEYRLLQQLYPDFMPPWNNSGRILMAMGKYSEAAAMFEKAAEVAPRNSIPLQNLWYVQLLYTKDPKAGEQTARRMVNLAPRLAYPFSFLGYSLAAQARLDEAEQEFRKAIAIEPDHPYALANLAHVLFASGRAAESVALYKKVLELTRQGKTSGDVEGDTLALTLALRESGDIEGAWSAAQEVRDSLLRKIEGSSPQTGILFSLGELEAIMGRTEQAESYLAKVLQKNIQKPDELMYLAELYALLGRDELAISTLKRSLEAGYSDYFFPVILPAFQKIRNHPEFRALLGLGE